MWEESQAQTRPLPSARDGEAVVRLLAWSLSDPETEELEPDRPLARAGIEALVVEVVSIQENQQWVPGDRLLVHLHAPCGCCEHCLGGHATGCVDARVARLKPAVLASHLVLPSWTLRRGTRRLPENVSDRAALAAVALARVRRAWLRLDRPVQGGILVMGSGATARAAGLYAERFHPNVRRVLLAEPGAEVPEASRLGFHAASVFSGLAEDREPLKVLCDGLPRLVVVACDQPRAVEEALEVVAPGGTVLLVVPPGTDEVPLDAGRLQRDEIRLVGTTGCTPDNLDETLRIVPDLETRMELLFDRTLRVSQWRSALDETGRLPAGQGMVLVRVAEAQGG